MGNLKYAVLVGLIYLLSTFLYDFYSRREAIVKYGLYPAGASIGKDFLAYLLITIPKAIRVLRTGSASIDVPKLKSTLEGFHTSLQFAPFQQGPKFLESKHFAENFYFWANIPGSTDFVLTTRLSFYGVNGSHIVPWFTFYYKGEEYNLPSDFELDCLPHKFMVDPRQCVSPKYGTLSFELISPMDHWRLKYEGVVDKKGSQERETVSAKFDIRFSENDNFIYGVHWDEVGMARAMSPKTWDESFFKNLRSQNQERYASRSHKAAGMIDFKGKKEKSITLPVLDSSRDHNWGIRNWNFLRRYVWWPAVKFEEAIEIEGEQYRYFTGSFVDYGNTIEDLIVGGFISNSGRVLRFASSNRMQEFAPEWFDKYKDEQTTKEKRKQSEKEKEEKRFVGIGEALVPSEMDITFIARSETTGKLFEIRTKIQRGTKKGLWSHSFWLKDGEFEIHEAFAKFEFSVLNEEKKKVAHGKAIGLFEFGANLVMYSDDL